MAEPMPPSPRRAGKVGTEVVRGAAAAIAGVIVWTGGCAGLESWDGFSDTARTRADAASSGGPDDDANADDAASPVKIAPGQTSSTAFDGPSVAQVDVPMKQPVTSGDLLVAAIGWYDDTVKLTSVTDSLGNTFHPASDPVIVTGSKAMVQVVYFASGVTGGATDTLTAKFDDRADSPDVRVAEYSGLAPTKADGVASQSGTSADPTTGPLTTQLAPMLLVAAGLTYNTNFTAAGPDFTVRVISESGNLLEDRVVDRPDTYTAHAVMQQSGWLMQLVAFH